MVIEVTVQIEVTIKYRVVVFGCALRLGEFLPR